MLGSANAVDEAPVPDPTHVLAVTNVEWARAEMTIQVLLSPLGDSAVPHTEPVITFQLVDSLRTLPVPAVSVGNGAYALHLNITAFGGRDTIPDGTWRVYALLDGERGPIASFDGARLSELDAASRVFLFDANRSSLTVSYGIADSGSGLDFLMRVFKFSRTPLRTSHPLSPKRLRERVVGKTAKFHYARWIYSFLTRFVGQKPGRVLFASDQRGGMEGNLLRVHDRMVEKGLDKKFDFRTSFRLPQTTRWPTTIHILYLIATSEIVLLDDYFAMLRGLKIDPRKRIIQLWHAGSGFKSVGYSRFGMSGSPNLWDAHRQYTFAITGSRHLVPVYAEVFGIEESAVIPTGLPRVDGFLDEERTGKFVEGFYAERPEFRNKRIVLFAPTYRGRSINNAFYDYDLIDFDALYKACGPDTVVLFRMHHFVKDEVPIPTQYKDRFFDFTRFKDGLSLLHVTDLLITDYSSIIYEFSLLDRPMLFFAPDEVNYSAVHGFHRDYYETAPGRVCTTFDALIDAITSNDYEQSKVTRFREQNFDRIDTGAADRVIDWLILNDPRTTPFKNSDSAGELHASSSATLTSQSQQKDEEL
ncbi:CDP-glycerol glycerophosphotransferase family protein [Salinibacterium sp. SWN139]|uniref:CDP-glycerol glycerophosphotransferase family protein n=1 Tax=Salinibacterium sp. SWN139 TaxID=2792055 RepID=UPI0018CCFA9C|nr:CDP-glycerol glycerophosphotransferase family protein [Salinibacterium sp. SWN139]MBH0053564.1 CDP-glycerol glycerophosphotransferase family protein [Salinibacterium sp. SWN139]